MRYRLWNYATQECILKRQLADDPLDIALHCTGLMLLTAFSDRVRLEFVLRYETSCKAIAMHCAGPMLLTVFKGKVSMAWV